MSEPMILRIDGAHIDKDDFRKARYMDALRRNPGCLDGFLSVPDELAAEFYEASAVEDNLHVQRGVLAFVQHALTLTRSDCGLGPLAITGLYHIVQGAMDVNERCVALMDAARCLERKGES